MTGKTFVPPIKIQGIKTKLVPFISENIFIKSDTLWIEPFMGSGVVGFNLAPKNAVFSDANPHIIQFYNEIKSGRITGDISREFLKTEGAKLKTEGAKHYYEVRKRFNTYHRSLDFLFLNRSCFNGMIRFNKNYEFNVPYGHKDGRFSKAYITKISNQIFHIQELLQKNNWTFECNSFEEVLKIADKNSFIYCDPPYIGRHVDYYDSWDEKQEQQLFTTLCKTNADFIVSTWHHNQYRKNEFIDTLWNSCRKVTTEHFYFVGAKEKNRNSITEALLSNKDFPKPLPQYRNDEQPLLFVV